jgi:alpha-mannosidase
MSGSSVDEGDVNVPSPESIIRQVLYGNRFMEREFGKISQDYMLPDCFGFPASVPSAWAHAGLKGFSTQKLTWGSAVGIPFKVGRWYGPDGNFIIAALDPSSYVSDIHVAPHKDNYWMDRVEKNGANYGVYTDFRYFGVGDIGGAPTIKDVEYVMESVSANSNVKIHAGASDQMFVDLTEDQKERLPKYKGDLLLTEHSAGSLTSKAYMKRWNRRNEILADNAERISVMAKILGTIPYPKEHLK